MEDTNSYSFFANRDCQYYPCHEKADPEHFNCLFCYCPLYALGERCGGNFRYTEKGIKDCSACLLPHRKGRICVCPAEIPGARGAGQKEIETKLCHAAIRPSVDENP